MALTTNDRIIRRLRDAKVNKSIKDSMYKLRRVVAGDYTAIGGDKVGVKYDDISQITKVSKMYPTFRPAIYEEGVGNHLYEWLKILVMQTVLQNPQIDFPDLEESHSKIREGYLHERLGKNSWTIHQEKMIFHFLIDGIGWMKLGLFNDIPVVRSVDSIDLLWDIHADLPNETTFMAQELRLKIDTARKLLGQAAIDKLPQGQHDDTDEDVVRVIEYWDVETLAYTTVDSFTVIKKMESPFRGFIPYVAMYGPIIPSTIYPLPHIVSVIGAQTAHSKLQRSINALASKLKPEVIVDPAAFTPESFRMWQDNPDDLTVLIRDRSYKSDTDPIRFIQPPRVTSDVLALKADLESEIVRHMGVNPFAAGAPIDSNFATEVAEIASRSGLNASFISGKLANMFGDIFRKLVRIGFKHDEEPYQTRMDGELITFEGPFSIAPLLEDDVICLVRPGSFETEEMKLIKNMQLLSALNNDPVMSKNTKLRREFWRNIVSSAGFRDIEGLITLEDDDTMIQLLNSVGVETPDQLAAIVQQFQQQQGQPEPAQPIGN